eukprot:gene610-8114_t
MHSIPILYIPIGEYSTTSNGENFHLNICGDAKSTCKDKAFPSVHNYDGKCGYLGTKYFKSSFIDNVHPEKGAILIYPHGVKLNKIRSNTEIKIVCQPKGVKGTTLICQTLLSQ